MGALANAPLTNAAATIVTVLIVSLNVSLPASVFA